MQAMAPCALCAAPIEGGEAWMANSMTGSHAHSGCVYRDEAGPEERERWQPSALAEMDPQRRTTTSGDVARQS